MAHNRIVMARHIHPKLATERVTKSQSEHVAPTALRVSEEADWVMGRIETFFMEIGATVTKRRPCSIKADVTHPDGFALCIYTKFYASADGGMNIVDILRRSGDGLLFGIVYAELRAYDFGRGERPKLLYNGQICPRPFMKAQPPPLVLTAFRVDSGGEKRKHANMLEL